MTRRMSMADQRDFYFAALKCIRVFGQTFEHVRRQVGALQKGEGQILA